MNTEQITRDISNRGMFIDQLHCRQQIALVERAKAAMLAEMSSITGLAKGNAPIPLREWLVANGCDMTDIQAATVRDAAMTATDPDVRRVLRLRQYVSKTPTSKYQAAINRVSADGRLRGMLTYCGATKTGRWSSTGINFQNLPRPIKKDKLAQEGTPERAMQDAANGIRAMIIAPPGRKLVVSDLSGIEAMLLAWLSGEEWVLDVFRRDESLYKATYSGMTGVPVSAVDEGQRFIGKVAALALGYAGGFGAFTQMAAGYGMDLAVLYDVVWPGASSDARSSAEWMLEYHINHGSDRGFPAEVILACEVIKVSWREANPMIVAFWRDLEEGWRSALNRPGTVVPVGKCAMTYGSCRTGPVLRITLPSGRHIHHHRPEADEEGLWYMSQNSMTRKWERTSTYGGSLAESAAQGAARDILAANLPLVDMQGFDITMLVHDEVIAEADERLSVDDLNASLATVPSWAKGLPLAAEGFEAQRYRK